MKNQHKLNIIRYYNKKIYKKKYMRPTQAFV